MTMTRKPLSPMTILALCALFLSCRSVLNYADAPPPAPPAAGNRDLNETEASAEAEEPVVAGYFAAKERRHEGDIVISGYLVHSVWSSFSPFTGDRYTWKGTASFSGREQPLVVVTWLTNPGTLHRNLNPVSVRGLPAAFECRDFPVLSSRPSFSRIETYPRIAEFALAGKKLVVEFVPQYRFQSMDNHFALIQNKKQTMRLVDENGKVYADFDMKSYRIYALPPAVSTDQLQMALAVFSVVQHICFELREG
jgi:hypothetical protein